MTKESKDSLNRLAFEFIYSILKHLDFGGSGISQDDDRKLQQVKFVGSQLRILISFEWVVVVEV